MKSRYICMFACLWGLGFLFSCDGFLNENPKDKIPEEDAYKNLTDLYYNAVASLYNNIGGYSDSQGLQGTGRGIYVAVTGTMAGSGKDFSCIGGEWIMMPFKPRGNIYIRWSVFAISHSNGSIRTSRPITMKNCLSIGRRSALSVLCIIII